MSARLFIRIKLDLFQKFSSGINLLWGPLQTLLALRALIRMAMESPGKVMGGRKMVMGMCSQCNELLS